jgi:SAM-dependent methyltransferase
MVAIARKLLGMFKESASSPSPSPDRLFPCTAKMAVLENGKPLVLWRGSETLQSWRCAECGYIFFDVPDLEFLKTYYQHEYPQSAVSWYNVENDYNPDRCRARSDLAISFALTFLGTDKVAYHESGCSFGGTVAALRDKGYDATGCELNKDAVAQGRARGNKWISDESDSEFLGRTKRRPNLIYSHHAVEHMPDPVGFLSGLKGLLDPLGVIFLTLPNAVSAVAMKRGFHGHPWFAYPDHLHLLSPRSLLCLAEKAGYQVVHVDTRMAAATEADCLALGADPREREGRLSLTMIEQTLMGAELRVVLTPIDSEVARRSRTQIETTRTKCLLSGETERKLLQLYAEQ